MLLPFVATERTKNKFRTGTPDRTVTIFFRYRGTEIGLNWKRKSVTHLSAVLWQVSLLTARRLAGLLGNSAERA